MGDAGELRGEPTPAFAGHAAIDESSEAAPHRIDESNTLAILDGRTLLKVYRRIEAGPHPEVEALRHLASKKPFTHTPALLGALRYQPEDPHPERGIGRVMRTGVAELFPSITEETGLKPYALLMKVLDQKGVMGVATIALRNKESLCALRPVDSTLVLETLHYPDEIRERELSLPDVLVNERELQVAGTLVDALKERFDPSKYHDHYREALLELIESKTQGREVVVPEGETAAPVTDLMEALRASIEQAQKRKGGGSSEEPREGGETRRDGKAKSEAKAAKPKSARGRRKTAA